MKLLKIFVHTAGLISLVSLIYLQLYVDPIYFIGAIPLGLAWGISIAKIDEGDWK